MRVRNRPDFDYNKPISVCSTCYTLGQWHCYDCGKNFCAEHYKTHKDNNQCINC
ncbi:MAG: hypothetical protein QW416_07005 [Candidatus Nitrosocaldaceae archaeon]